MEMRKSSYIDGVLNRCHLYRVSTSLVSWSLSFRESVALKLMKSHYTLSSGVQDISTAIRFWDKGFEKLFYALQFHLNIAHTDSDIGAENLQDMWVSESDSSFLHLRLQSLKAMRNYLHMNMQFWLLANLYIRYRWHCLKVYSDSS